MTVSVQSSNKNRLVLITNPNFKEPQLEKADRHFNPLVSNVLDTLNEMEYLELGYEQIRDIEGKPASASTIYVFGMEGKSVYKPLEFLEISSSREKVYITAEVNFRMSEWNEKISLLSFSECIRSVMKEKFAITSDQKNLFDEDLLHIRFKIIATRDQNLTLVIEKLARKLERMHLSIFAQHAKQQLYLAS